jgi:tetratricopeptide (TPR) repeat protein
MTGEPGVGKTRLIAEFQSFVDAQPEIVWWRQGRCLPYGEGIMFWALGEIVKAHVGILESDTSDEARSKVRAAVEALVEDETDRDWFTTRIAPLTGAQTSNEAVSREESFSAWQRFLESIAAERPIAVVIEDLHWADDALVEFLDHLVDWSSGVPLMLLVAARPELYERHPGWGGGKRNSVTISLGPLSDEETARLVASLVGRSVLPAETQTALLERAGGNPLYTEEFVRMLSESGAPAADTPLPETVQALIAARLDTLPPARKSLLQDAAVLGKVFWTGGVAAIGRVDEHEVKEGMRELVRKELVRPARRSSVEGQEELVFWHVLVRDVAYQQIPRAARAQKHQAACDWIEAFARERTEDHAEILVHHAEQALELARASGVMDLAELEQRLARFLVLAGERARRLDMQKANHYYARALKLMTDPPAELLEQAGGAAWDAGETSKGLEMLEEALRRHRARGDVLGVGRSLSLLAQFAWTLGRGGDAVRLLDESLEALEPEGPSPELAMSLMRLAGREMLSGHPGEVIAPAERSIELAQQFGVEDRVLFAWQARGVAMCELGDPRGLDALQDALTRALDAGAPGLSGMVAYNNLSFNQWLMESPRVGLATKLEGLAFTARRGIREYWLAMEIMWIHFDLGLWDEVLADADQLLDLHVKMGGQSQIPAAAPVYKSFVLTFRGRWPEVADAPDAFLPAAREIVDTQVVVPALSAATVVAHARGDAAAAVALVEELEQVTRTTPDWSRLLHALPVLRVCIDLDRLELGARLFDRPDPIGARQQAVSAAGRAAIAEARGDTDQAARLFAEGARLLKEYELPFEQGHALLGHWRCAGEDASLREAQALFDSLGAVVPQATAEEPRAARRAK